MALDTASKDKQLLTEIGEFVRARIFSTTKAGMSMDGDPDQPFRLPQLQPSSIEIRTEFAKNHRVGSFFKASRSNLTMTGQMLDALFFEINTGRGSVKVSVRDTTRREIKPGGITLSNKGVAEDLAGRGFGFIGLDKAGRATVRQMVIKAIRRELIRLRLKK